MSNAELFDLIREKLGSDVALAVANYGVDAYEHGYCQARFEYTEDKTPPHRYWYENVTLTDQEFQDKYGLSV